MRGKPKLIGPVSEVRFQVTAPPAGKKPSRPISTDLRPIEEVRRYMSDKPLRRARVDH